MFIFPGFPNFPCAAYLLICTIALGCVMVTLALRMLFIMVQIRYNQLLSENKPLVISEETSTSVSSSSPHFRFCSQIFRLFAIAHQRNRLLHINNLDEVIFPLHAYVIVAVTHTIPIFLALGITYAVDPYIFICTDCDRFADTLIVTVVSIVFADVVLFNFALNALAIFRQVEDDQGLFLEMRGSILVAGSIFDIVVILFVVDPGQLMYDRKFSWSWLYFFTASAMWWYTFGVHVFAQWKQHKRLESLRLHQVNASPLPNFDDVWTDKEILAQFEDFASKHYVLELLYFIQDIQMYKALYSNHDSKWRWINFTSIVTKYIEKQSLYEINISDNMREHILEAYRKKDQNVDFEQVLEEAYQEVLNLLHYGLWNLFVLGIDKVQKPKNNFSVNNV